VRALNILVVDDDLTNCEAMESYVSQLGHRVSIATTAAQGMAHAAPFDVALVDFDLGEGSDGLHLIAALRLQQPAARFALVTATHVKEFINRDELTGVAILQKPVSAGDLEAWRQAQLASGSAHPVFSKSQSYAPSQWPR
jgi:CheY-like chemotaxis protein